MCMGVPFVVLSELLARKRFVSELSGGEMIETIGVSLVNLTGCASWGMIPIATFG
jgi:hypothetical protein